MKIAFLPPLLPPAFPVLIYLFTLCLPSCLPPSFSPSSFVVHGGLNLGLDLMLYRGTPQRYHAEFGVLLRYPPSNPPSSSSISEARGEGEGEGELGKNENDLSWRDLHLLYRLIGVSGWHNLRVMFPLSRLPVVYALFGAHVCFLMSWPT